MHIVVACVYVCVYVCVNEDKWCKVIIMTGVVAYQSPPATK